MKDRIIYCVEFFGNDKKWHQETNWHTSKVYCEKYIDDLGNPSNRRINWTNLFVD